MSGEAQAPLAVQLARARDLIAQQRALIAHLERRLAELQRRRDR